MSLFATKSLERIKAESESGEHHLKKTLGPVNLVALGIGAIIGAGLFSLTGIAAADNAGPAVVLSFVLAAIGCAFAGMCYSEFSTMIPIAGSAYTYAYATMGELLAWIIGWDLVLEYAVGAATVSVSWSSYVSSSFTCIGIDLPESLVALSLGSNRPGLINLPAMLIIVADLHPADHRHLGIGPGERRHRGDQGHHRPGRHLRRLGLHQPGQLHAVHSRRTRASSASSAGAAFCGPPA